MGDILLLCKRRPVHLVVQIRCRGRRSVGQSKTSKSYVLEWTEGGIVCREVDLTGADAIGGRGQVRFRDDSWLCAINPNSTTRKPSEVNVRKPAAIGGIERVVWFPDYGTC